MSSKVFPRPRRVGLFDLPRELRDSIYSYSLVSTQAIPVVNLAREYQHYTPRQNLDITPALLRACRQVYLEALQTLYGLNTFIATVNITLDSAVQQLDVQRAIGLLNLAPDFNPPERPDIVCITDRPQYEHPNMPLVKRVEVKVRRMVPQAPKEPERRCHNALHDICLAFVEHKDLDVFILTTEEQTLEHVVHASRDPLVAQWMHTTLRHCWEWHVERAILAAARQRGSFWIDSASVRKYIDMRATCWSRLRRVADAEWRSEPRNNDVWDLPRRFQCTGQLASRQ